MTSPHPEHSFSQLADLLMALSMTIGRSRAARMAADSANIGPDTDLVDVGAGPGTAAREAARRGARVTAVEPSPAARRLAHLLTRRRLRPRVQIAEGTAERLPCPDNSADVAWALSSAHHWHDLRRAASEISRALRAGGQLLIVERIRLPGDRRAHHAVDPGWQTRLCHLLADAGFEHVHAQIRGMGRDRRLIISARTRHDHTTTQSEEHT